jgi:two-component system, cell cycle sensor histidine kinase and response regulator CckA
VESDALVLEVVRTILEHAGFNVLTAANSTEAIRVESTTKRIIHLLLTDVMMPDMSGPIISKILKEHRPDMRVILMSGYASGDMLFLNYGWHFVEKPFLPVKLLERVNDVLHSPERSQGDQDFDTRVEAEEAAVT